MTLTFPGFSLMGRMRMRKARTSTAVTLWSGSIKDYNEIYSTNFSTDTSAAYHKDISDRVKGKKTKPLDILLVVNMFLTGFDSKTLSVLYVDKDLKYHDLLQAYSRTNRVEKETKPFGIVICYRNLKNRRMMHLPCFQRRRTPPALLYRTITSSSRNLTKWSSN